MSGIETSLKNDSRRLHMYTIQVGNWVSKKMYTKDEANRIRKEVYLKEQCFKQKVRVVPCEIN